MPLPWCSAGGRGRRWGPILAAVLLGTSPLLRGVAAGGGFAEDLFQNALPLAQRSLDGRFIKQMVAGTLPKAVFQHYLHQDNLYLTKYARAFAVIGAKVDTTEELRWLIHKSDGYLKEHGSNGTVNIDEQTFEREALPTTEAYTSFIMQAAWGEDLVLGYAAALPCQRLYDWLFATINATLPIAPDNPYKDYILQYADLANHQTSEEMGRFLDAHVEHGVSAETRARAQLHYNTALKYEADFFDQALRHCETNECGDVSIVAASRTWALHREGAPAEAATSTQAAAAAAIASTPPMEKWALAAALAMLVAASAGGVLGRRGREQVASVALLASAA